MIEFIMFVNYPGTIFPIGSVDNFTTEINVPISYINCIIWMLLTWYWIKVSLKYTESFTDNKSDEFKQLFRRALIRINYRK
jgi:hypothetical protein